MSEEGFVQMLLEAAAGNVTDERDVGLARAAAQWALRHNWRPYLGDRHGYICNRAGLEFWVDNAPGGGFLILLARLQPGTGWRSHARYPIAHLGHALTLLAAEELIPARYSPLGRRALEDHAETLERTARRTPDVSTSAALRLAADSARRFAGAELAVLA